LDALIPLALLSLVTYVRIAGVKIYDKAYFDRWYRSKRRVISAALIRRKVQMAVGIAEHLLERRLRSVLDVGCGEGSWLRPLRELRPSIRYLGLDASEYAAQTFGKRRNIRLARFGDTAKMIGERRFDLVVSSDVLHYLEEEELDAGLVAIAAATRGIAFLELLTKEDAPAGDLRGFKMRPAAWYAERFANAGLIACGMQCYAGPNSVLQASALDVLPR